MAKDVRKFRNAKYDSKRVFKEVKKSKEKDRKSPDEFNPYSRGEFRARGWEPEED